MSKKYFKDESIFCGVKEFNTPTGRLRATRDDHGYKIYEEDGDVFIYSGFISSSRRMSCESIYNKYIS